MHAVFGWEAKTKKIFNTWHAHHIANHLKAACGNWATMWDTKLTISLFSLILYLSHYIHLMSGCDIDTGHITRGFLPLFLFILTSLLSFLTSLFPPPLLSVSVGILSPAGGQSVSKDSSNCLAPWQHAMKTTVMHACTQTNTNTHTLIHVYVHAQRKPFVHIHKYKLGYTCAQGGKSPHTHSLTHMHTVVIGLQLQLIFKAITISARHGWSGTLYISGRS